LWDRTTGFWKAACFVLVFAYSLNPFRYYKGGCFNRTGRLVPLYCLRGLSASLLTSSSPGGAKVAKKWRKFWP